MFGLVLLCNFILSNAHHSIPSKNLGESTSTPKGSQSNFIPSLQTSLYYRCQIQGHRKSPRSFLLTYLSLFIQINILLLRQSITYQSLYSYTCLRTFYLGIITSIIRRIKREFFFIIARFR